MATGLTGTPIHTGSWLGLPDFGITEALQGQLTTSPSPTGLITNTGAPAPVPQTQPIYTNFSSLTTPTPTPTPTPTAPAPTGGTGNQVLGLNDQQTGGTEDLTAQLDAIFNPQLATLTGQEGAVNTQYNDTVSGIQGQYGLSQTSIGQANTQGQQELAQTGKEAGTRKEDALTSATRLYNELQKGGQQRFGGASSAGEAYQSLTAVEQQRKQGAIQTAYESAMQQVGALKANLQQKFVLATKELEVQKNSALAEAKSSFDEGMRQIQAARNQLGSDRATASLNLLQDLRNKVYAINMQNLQFQQQLALNNQTQQSTVDQYVQQKAPMITQGQTGVSQFGTQAMNTAGETRLGIGSGQVQSPQLQTGRVLANKNLDQFGNPIV